MFSDVIHGLLLQPMTVAQEKLDRGKVHGGVQDSICPPIFIKFDQVIKQ